MALCFVEKGLLQEHLRYSVGSGDTCSLEIERRQGRPTLASSALERFSYQERCQRNLACGGTLCLATNSQPLMERHIFPGSVRKRDVVFPGPDAGFHMQEGECVEVAQNIATSDSYINRSPKELQLQLIIASFQ